MVVKKDRQNRMSCWHVGRPY